MSSHTTLGRAAAAAALLAALAAAPAAGQIRESFDDGDFTANPAWTGHVDSFLVATPHTAGDGSLTAATDGHVLGSLPGARSSALLLESPWAYGEWSFSMAEGRNWAVSGTNDYLVILMADTADPAAFRAPMDFNGYYLRFDGSQADTYVLYRQSGAEAVPVVATGWPEGNDGTGSAPRSFKVRREPGGLWSLYIDDGWGVDATTLRGTGADDAVAASRYFGLATNVASPSASRAVWFDNLYIGPPVTDTLPPAVVAAQATGPRQATVLFSEAVEPASAADVGNYLIANQSAPVSALLAAPDRVDLAFAADFPQGQPVPLRVSGVADMAGNVMQPHLDTLMYAPPRPGDVVFNEIFYDPNPPVGLPEHDFLELHNRSGHAVDLGGWTLTVGTRQVAFPSRTLAAGGFLILAPAAAMEAYASFGPALPLLAAGDLTNAGKALALADTSGQVIHAVTYSPAFHDDPGKADGGWSVEQVDPEGWCQQASNWRSSVAPLGGTPGAQSSVLAPNPDTAPPAVLSAGLAGLRRVEVRFSEAIDPASAVAPNFAFGPGNGIAAISQSTGLETVILDLETDIELDVDYTLTVAGVSDFCGNAMAEPYTALLSARAAQPGDVVVNEIMADPTPVVGLPEHDFVELHNRAAHAVGLGGWTLAVGDRAYALPARTLAAGGFLIVTTSAGAAEYESYGDALGLIGASDLVNAGRTVELRDSAGAVIHTVSYHRGFYRDEAKADGGWSMEQIDPEGWCQQASNWRASRNLAGGTPGAPNSVLAANVDTLPPALLSAWAEGPRRVALAFDEELSPASAADLSRFAVEGAVVVAAARDSADRAVVNLDLGADLRPGEAYVATAQGVADHCGNASGAAQATFALSLDDWGSVVFNEILCRPQAESALPNVTYIELLNRGATAVNLRGWTLASGNSSYTFPAVEVAAGGFAVVKPASAAVNVQGAAPEVPLYASNFVSESGKTLELRNREGRLSHWVAYTSAWYNDDFKKLGGWSLEQIDPANPCGGAGNWTASVAAGHGTPGQPNSVSGRNPDIVAPEMLHAAVDNDSCVTLIFSEPLHYEPILADSLWSLAPAHAAIVAVVADEPRGGAVSVRLSAALDPQATYALRVPLAADCAGNPGSALTVEFRLPCDAAEGDIVINEILFDPPAGGNEYVELYNNTDNYFALNRLYAAGRESDGSLKSPALISDHGVLLRPADYLVLTKSRPKVTAHYVAGDSLKIVETQSLPSMPNAAGHVALLNVDGQVVDELSYDAGMHTPLLRGARGVALERVDPLRPTQNASNWQSAAETYGFGTPAAPNSQLAARRDPDAGRRVTAQPRIFSPDGDGYDDYTLLTYAFDQGGYALTLRVFDANGRQVRDLAQNHLAGLEGQIKWDGADDDGNRVPVGIYIVLVEYHNATGEAGREKLVVTVAHRD